MKAEGFAATIHKAIWYSCSIQYGPFVLCLAGEEDVIPRTITVDYASVEVVQSIMDQVAEAEFEGSRIIGPAADIWSSAVVLYLMLTGQLPFDCRQLCNPAREGSHFDSMLEAMFEEHWNWVSILRACLDLHTCA